MNGGRGRSNNFSVNGGDANDLFANLPTVQPSPDSISEFRVLTNTFDAEYGRNSGSVVNVVTKSGTNEIHGSAYEFFRNKVLNSNNYCLTAAEGLPCAKPQFNQNQFGGTLGGPIIKNRTFIFASYEGRRVRQGILSPAVTVPTSLERPSATNLVNGQIVGDFSGVQGGSPFAGTLANSAILSGRPGCQAATTAIGGGTISDGALYSDIFPGQQIPVACMDPTAVDLLQFVPTAPNGGSLVSTVPVRAVRGDQLTLKFDHRINDKQNLSVYYYFNDDTHEEPVCSFELAGAISRASETLSRNVSSSGISPTPGRSTTPLSMNSVSITTAKARNISASVEHRTGAKLLPAAAVVADGRSSLFLRRQLQ